MAEIELDKLRKNQGPTAFTFANPAIDDRSHHQLPRISTSDAEIAACKLIVDKHANEIPDRIKKSLDDPNCLRITAGLLQSAESHGSIWEEHQLRTSLSYFNNLLLQLDELPFVIGSSATQYDLIRGLAGHYGREGFPGIVKKCSEAVSRIVEYRPPYKKRGNSAFEENHERADVGERPLDINADINRLAVLLLASAKPGNSVEFKKPLSGIEAYNLVSGGNPFSALDAFHKMMDIRKSFSERSFTCGELIKIAWDEASKQILEKTSGAKQALAFHMLNNLMTITDMGGKLITGEFPKILDIFNASVNDANFFDFKSLIEAPAAFLFYGEALKNGCSKEKALDMVNVLGEMGIECFQRFDFEILNNVYLTATAPAFSENKKLAFIALTKNDLNGAFAEDRDLYHDLIAHGYCLAMTEMENDFSLLSYFKYGFHNPDAPSALKNSGRKYDLVMLGAHGEPGNMLLGKAGDFDNRLALDSDLADPVGQMFLGRHWSDMLTDGATVVLWSCTTAGQLGEADKKKYWQTGDENVQEFALKLFHDPDNPDKKLRVIAPTDATHVTKWHFDSSNIVEDVEWAILPLGLGKNQKEIDSIVTEKDAEREIEKDRKMRDSLNAASPNERKE